MEDRKEIIDKAMTNVYRDIAILYDLGESIDEINEFDKKVLEFINLEHYGAESKLKKEAC